MLEEAQLIGGMSDGLTVHVPSPRPLRLDLTDADGAVPRSQSRYVIGHRGLQLVYVLEELAPKLVR